MRTIASSSSTLNTSLTAYWKLDETSDGSAPVTRVDSGANGQDLTDNNTTASGTGKINNAGQFVATNAEFLSRADSSTLSTGDIDFSVSCWIYMDSKTATMTFVAKFQTSGAQREYRVWYRQASDRFRFTVSNNGTAETDVEANVFGSPSLSTWYFIVASHNAATDVISISVNAGTPNTGAHATGVFDSTAPFGIGARQGGSDPMNGMIDEVGFWKKVLSSDERTELYNAGAGKTCCPF